MLKEKLEKIANASASRTPDEIKLIMDNGLNRLVEGEYAKKAFNVDDEIPDCELKNHRGESVSMHQLMGDKPAIITFYRGGW